MRLSGTDRGSWFSAMSAATAALRLNKQFPPWRRLVAHLQAMARLSPTIDLDPGSGLPEPSDWTRIRGEHQLAAETLYELGRVDLSSLTTEERHRVSEQRRDLKALEQIEPLPTREIQVALRQRTSDRASYRVIVDRFDLASTTVARYTLLLADTPGRSVSRGELELRASDHFAAGLALLATQDAALAFAILREEGLVVEEVVRGTVGPALIPSACGPQVLRQVVTKPALSAVLERASIHLQGIRVDDPITHSVTLPNDDVDFGVAWQRKWAVAQIDVPVMRAWLDARGSRNLIYSYTRP